MRPKNTGCCLRKVAIGLAVGMLVKAPKGSPSSRVSRSGSASLERTRRMPFRPFPNHCLHAFLKEFVNNCDRGKGYSGSTFLFPLFVLFVTQMITPPTVESSERRLVDHGTDAQGSIVPLEIVRREQVPQLEHLPVALAVQVEQMGEPEILYALAKRTFDVPVVECVCGAGRLVARFDGLLDRPVHVHFDSVQMADDEIRLQPEVVGFFFCAIYWSGLHQAPN